LFIVYVIFYFHLKYNIITKVTKVKKKNKINTIKIHIFCNILKLKEKNIIEFLWFNENLEK